MAGITFQAITPKKKLQLVNEQGLFRSAHLNMKNYLESIKSVMQNNYDSAKKSPKYKRRKENDGIWSGWEITVSSDGLEGSITNEIRGAAYVQGPRRLRGESTVSQLPQMRQRGWKSITDVAQQQHASYVRVMARSIIGEENA